MNLRGQILAGDSYTRFSRSADHVSSIEIIAIPCKPIERAYSLMLSLLISAFILDVPLGYVTQNSAFGFSSFFVFQAGLRALSLRL
jgi:hypothetical protein